MEYENLIKECFDTFSIQPTGKNSRMKTKILKKFYEESLSKEYKEYNFFEDLIKYTLKTNKSNKHGLVDLIRVEEEKIYDEVQKDLLKDEIQLIKLAIKNCCILFSLVILVKCIVWHWYCHILFIKWNIS